MHPPFYVVDHKIDHARPASDSRPFEDRKIIRRNRPEGLRLTVPAPGFPFGTTCYVQPPMPVRRFRPFGWAWLMAALRPRSFGSSSRADVPEGRETP